MNFIQNNNSESIKDMDLEMDKNKFSFSNRTNSIFTNSFQNENLKLLQNNPNHIYNNFSPNIHNIINNTNSINVNNNIQNKSNENIYPFVNNENTNIFNNNIYNQFYENDMKGENQSSSFTNFFKMNSNTDNSQLQNINNNNNANNIIINSSNFINKEEKGGYNCTYDNIILNNNNYINYGNIQNNLNYAKRNN